MTFQTQGGREVFLTITTPVALNPSRFRRRYLGRGASYWVLHAGREDRARDSAEWSEFCVEENGESSEGAHTELSLSLRDDELVGTDRWGRQLARAAAVLNAVAGPAMMRTNAAAGAEVMRMPGVTSKSASGAPPKAKADQPKAKADQPTAKKAAGAAPMKVS